MLLSPASASANASWPRLSRSVFRLLALEKASTVVVVIASAIERAERDRERHAALAPQVA